VICAVLVNPAGHTQRLAEAAGGPTTWSDEAETAIKRELAWNRHQLHTDWDYLVRRASDQR
jgi:hypothetical protein